MIYAHLSQDEYHDPVDHEVIEAFGEQKDFYHGVWDTSQDGSREPLPHGRALGLLGYDEDDPPERTENDCICPQWMCKPDGRIYQCGCNDSPQIGDVESEVSPTPYNCWRSQDFIEECLENGE